MNSEQFTYWLQGFCELSGDTMPTQEQWDVIREHLNTVFYKTTTKVVGDRSIVNKLGEVWAKPATEPLLHHQLFTPNKIVDPTKLSLQC